MEHISRVEAEARFSDASDGQRLSRIKGGMKAADKRKVTTPRAANTYRGARRNAARGKVWMKSGWGSGRPQSR